MKFRPFSLLTRFSGKRTQTTCSRRAAARVVQVRRPKNRQVERQRASGGAVVTRSQRGRSDVHGRRWLVRHATSVGLRRRKRKMRLDRRRHRRKPKTRCLERRRMISKQGNQRTTLPAWVGLVQPHRRMGGLLLRDGERERHGKWGAKKTRCMVVAAHSIPLTWPTRCCSSPTAVELESLKLNSC